METTNVWKRRQISTARYIHELNNMYNTKTKAERCVIGPQATEKPGCPRATWRQAGRRDTAESLHSARAVSSSGDYIGSLRTHPDLKIKKKTP